MLITNDLNVNTGLNIIPRRSTSLIDNDLKVNINVNARRDSGKFGRFKD
jgi:hypothetical protein